MRYGVGIDLGTSFTSAAISGPGGTRMVPMSPAVIVPSVARRGDGGILLTGDAAADSGGDPAATSRNFKRRLGDPTPLVLGGATYSPAALMAAQLRDVLATVTRISGEPPGSVVLTYPAIWGPYRREHFTEVPRLARVADFRLITEPEAAATHYAGERRLGDGETIAVYDLGGGTFDSTVLRMRGRQVEILGTPEGVEHLGGIDFDEALFAHVDQRLDGAISALDPADPAAAAAIAATRAACVRAKEELSTEPDVQVAVPLPSGTRELTVTRREFDEMIMPSVRLTIDALRRTTASAGLRVEDLSAVLLAGGSSRVPLIAQVVEQEFGKPLRATLHPKYTVALGAALISGRPAPRTEPAPAPAATPGLADAPTTRTPIPPPAPSTAPEQPTVRVAAPAGPPPRRKWLWPAIAAVAVVVVGLVAVLAVATRSTAPGGPLPLYEGGAVAESFGGYLGSDSNWSGTAIPPEGIAHPGEIAATPDGDGMRVVWSGDSTAQVYLQTTNPEGSLDLRPYVDGGGALVFEARLNAEPGDGAAEIAEHCHYPCAGALPAAKLFGDLPVGRTTTVKIPLTCFTAAGLDPERVNTPFLVSAQRRLDVTFSEVRLEPDTAEDPDTRPCTSIR
ncbi:Hsp70 family protein [Saccharopolyspora sp. NPDC047091]|uniref:Hsp70 family protein n=1 Tax=Saccharopolyspora sp. NPDC047091 TaxID=3155924 RepID=UPI0033EB6CF0